MLHRTTLSAPYGITWLFTDGGMPPRGRGTHRSLALGQEPTETMDSTPRTLWMRSTRGGVAGAVLRHGASA